MKCYKKNPVFLRQIRNIFVDTVTSSNFLSVERFSNHNETEILNKNIILG